MAKNNRQRARWVGLGRVQSFMLILGRVGSGWVTKFSILGGSGWVGLSVKISNKYAIYMQEIRGL